MTDTYLHQAYNYLEGKIGSAADSFGSWWSEGPSVGELESYGQQYKNELDRRYEQYESGEISASSYKETVDRATLLYQAQTRTNGEYYTDMFELVTLFAGTGAATKPYTGSTSFLKFAQQNYNESYSKWGRADWTAKVGQPVETIDDVASHLRSGAMKVDDVPVHIVRTGSETIVVNTRSFKALERAGIEPGDMKIIDSTGDPEVVKRVADQLNNPTNGRLIVVNDDTVIPLGPGGFSTTTSTGKVFKPLPQNKCFLPGTPITLWDGSQKPIEAIELDDLVTAYDPAGQLVPGRVTQQHRNRVPHILDLFGLMVTPGHVTLRGDGPLAGQHQPVLEILREDGALVKEDGSRIRATTGCALGSPEDGFVWLVTGDLRDDGQVVVRDSGKLRLGARVILPEGQDVALMDLIRAVGGEVTEGGLVRQANGQEVPFYWSHSNNLPRPEDYVLARSGLTLDDIYRAGSQKEAAVATALQ